MTATERAQGLERLSRGFMTPDVYQTDIYIVSHDHGSSTVVLLDAIVRKAKRNETLKLTPDVFADYVDGVIDTDDDGHAIVELVRDRWIGRLSAPGYLDCTEWYDADTEAEVVDYLIETYDIEDE